jgi:hypothetical protein
MLSHVLRWDIIALARPQVFFRNVSELFAVAETLFEVRVSRSSSPTRLEQS